ncbi:MAG TPA: MFS transporter [Candidatus Nitrosopolaris sp.]|nr:MFS transporter [Candidatus Nitrosopolaris sp.]
MRPPDPVATVPDRDIWQPLRRRAFFWLWTAAIVSNVGTWMHDTAAAWTMATLAPSPLMVSLMQTAMTFPFFVLALPAGALADIVDRRRMLIVTQAWMLAAATALGALALAGSMTPPRLLALTFAIGIGSAMTAPAWQATTPDLVPRPELPAAVALGGISVNVARAIGPALGGLLVGAAGAGPVFLLNAASFLGVLVVLANWRRERKPTQLPPERVIGAMRAGVRYVRHATGYHAVLVRDAAFVLAASAVWALLPLVARTELHLDASGYGLVLGGLGLGAIGGALMLPRLRRWVSLEILLAAATVLFAVASGGLALVHGLRPALALTFAGGTAWMTMMSTLTVAAQESVPAWVRARALAVGLLVIQGSMATGALVWGVVATHTGLDTALLAAAGALVASLVVAPRFRLDAHDGLDLGPSDHMGQLVVQGDVDFDEGPVLVTVEYRVDPARAEAFVGAMEDLERTRRRDGAIRWGLFQDTADAWRWLETFLVESWVEHLRQHERVTMSDRLVRDRVYALIEGGEPRVSHLVARRED